MVSPRKLSVAATWVPRREPVRHAARTVSAISETVAAVGRVIGSPGKEA
jgi:hypothetical protein